MEKLWCYSSPLSNLVVIHSFKISAPSGLYPQQRYHPSHADIIAHHPSSAISLHDTSHTKLPPLNPSTTTDNNDDDYNDKRWNNDPMIR